MSHRLVYWISPCNGRLQVKLKDEALPPVVDGVLAPWLACHARVGAEHVEVRRVLRSVHPNHQRRLSPHREWKGAGVWGPQERHPPDQVTSLGVFMRCPDGLYRSGVRSEAAEYQRLVEQAIREAHVRGVGVDGRLFLTMGGVKFLPVEPGEPWAPLTPSRVLPCIWARDLTDDARIRERDKLAVDPATPGMVLALDALKRQVAAWVHLHGATVRAVTQRAALAAVRKAVKEARAAGVLEADLQACLQGAEAEPAAPVGRVKIDGVDRLRAIFSSFSFRPSDWWACIITPTGETKPTAMALESLVEGRLLADYSPLSPLVLPWTDEVQALVRMAEIKTAPYERSGIRGLYEPRPDLARVLHQHVLEGVGR